MVSITGGVYALWYVLWLERWRARVPEVIDPIIFGGLSLLLGLLCLAALPAARSGPMRWLFGAGACAGLLASALSGTRGAWIALPFGLVVLDRCQWQYLGARWRWSALAGVAAIVVALVAWPDTHVRDRVGDAYTAIARTFTEDGGGGSGFWFRPTLYATVTGEIIPASPWVGHGPVALRDQIRQLAEQAGASSNLKRLADRPEATQHTTMSFSRSSGAGQWRCGSQRRLPLAVGVFPAGPASHVPPVEPRLGDDGDSGAMPVWGLWPELQLLRIPDLRTELHRACDAGGMGASCSIFSHFRWVFP